MSAALPAHTNTRVTVCSESRGTVSEASSAAWLAPVSDASVEASIGPAPAAAARRKGVARYVDLAALAAVTAAGLACPWGVGRWYAALLVSFAGIGGYLLVGAAVTTYLGERSEARVQGPRKRPTFALRGARDTAVAAWIAACLVAWAVSRSWAGLPIGLTWSAREAGGALPATLQTLGAIVVLDAWLYWKHLSLIHISEPTRPY